MDTTKDLFEPSYEDNFLMRDLGGVVKRADIALTELVANAYDAGASRVEITIPNEHNKPLVVADNGVGMTKEHFQQRWMTLRYNRMQHQGGEVEFPDDRESIKRKAFGRNGIGRHGLLCFNDEYTLETTRDSEKLVIDITTKQPSKPLAVTNIRSEPKEGHGTKLSVNVIRHLPSPTHIAEIISARFIATPDFTVSVNGRVLQLHQHPGIVDSCEIKCEELCLKLTLIDSKQNRKDSLFSGAAIWVGGRLVGEPSWKLAGESLIDSRRSFANRYLLVIETEDLRDDISDDWSEFRQGSKNVGIVAREARTYINRKRREFKSEEIAETKKGIYLANQTDLKEMSLLARKEINGFIDDIILENPDFNLDTLHLAVRAAINLEKSRAGLDLLRKLASLSDDDINSLDELLEQWSVHDALVVLSEIDQRLKVIETLNRFCSDKNADELHTIHPLVFKARWLFGPEFESSEYSSNNTLRQTISRVFGKKVDTSAFLNARKRPDIVALKESSIQSLAIEAFDGELVRIQHVLLIEVKRGGFSIGREEMNQADGYVQDIAFSGLGDISPKISAFVVGHEIEPKTAKIKQVHDSDDNKTLIGTIKAVTFSTLIDTAERRLFKLREVLNERYDGLDRDEMFADIMEGEQIAMTFNSTKAS